MKKSKINKIALGALVLGLMVSSMGVAEASRPGAFGDNNPMQDLVAKISEKFNLNPNEVQQVFDEQRDAMKAKHKEQEVARLTKAVSEGKLTQAQADLIVAKRAELQNLRISFEGKSKDEIVVLMQSQKVELEKWIAENNIPKEFMFGVVGGHQGGMKGPKSGRSMMYHN